MRNRKPDHASEEVRVRTKGVVIAETIVYGVRCKIEFAALRLGFFDILVPALEEKIGIVAKVDVLAGNAPVDLEHSMLVEAKRRPECIWDARVGTSDAIYTTH